MKAIREAAVAEFIGTFALCFIGAGAVCVDRLSSGSLGLLGIAIAHGTVLAVMISALGHISGGQFNPAVTFGLWVGGKLEAFYFCFGSSDALAIVDVPDNISAAALATAPVPTATSRTLIPCVSPARRSAERRYQAPEPNDMRPMMRS